MAGIVEKLRALVSSKRQEEHKSAWDGYASILHDLAAGRELDPVEVSQALEAVGRSVDDLESDLEKFKRRLEWRQELDRLPALERDLAAAAAEHSKLKAEWDRLVPTLDAKIQAAHVARQAIEHAINTANSAEAWLLAQPLNSALVEQEQRLTKRQTELMGERQDWLDKIGAELANATYSADCARRQPEHAKYHNELEQAYRKRAAAFDPHLAKVETELASLRGELARVREQKLQP